MIVTLLLAFLALLLWSYVFLVESRRGIGWTSPTCLFSLGINIFYIIPSIYWMIRPWTSDLPPYFDGLWIVMLSAIILGLPFLFYALQRRNGKNLIPIADFLLRSRSFSNKLSWIFIIIAIVSVFFEVELLRMGNQSRLGTQQITFFGSSDLGYLIVNNLLGIWPIFYIFLIFFGGKKSRVIGMFLWMADGVISASTLQRTQILNFLLYSFVILGLLGYKFSIKKIIFSILIIVFTLVVVGNTPKFVRNYVESQGVESLNTVDVVGVLYRSLVDSMVGSDSNLLKYSDLTMERLYEARSASAVMASVPDKINYQYGSTMLHLFYAFVPRFFWPEKPSLREIHLFTVDVMPNDSGINPLGTLGEFYINFGLLFVFFGGLMSLWCCHFLESRFVSYYQTNRHSKLRALIIIYPVSAIWIFGSAYNFTQRLSEGLRLALVFFCLYLLFRIFKK
jgi:hypothetical protein